MRYWWLCLLLLACAAPALGAEPQTPRTSLQLKGAAGALTLHLALTGSLTTAGLIWGGDISCSRAPTMMMCELPGMVLLPPVGFVGGTLLSAGLNAWWLGNMAEEAGLERPQNLFGRGLWQGGGWGALVGASVGAGIGLAIPVRGKHRLDRAFVFATVGAIVGWSVGVPVGQAILAFEGEPVADSLARPMMPLVVVPF